MVDVDGEQPDSSKLTKKRKSDTQENLEEKIGGKKPKTGPSKSKPTETQQVSTAGKKAKTNGPQKFKSSVSIVLRVTLRMHDIASNRMSYNPQMRTLTLVERKRQPPTRYSKASQTKPRTVDMRVTSSDRQRRPPVKQGHHLTETRTSSGGVPVLRALDSPSLPYMRHPSTKMVM